MDDRAIERHRKDLEGMSDVGLANSALMWSGCLDVASARKQLCAERLDLIRQVQQERATGVPA